MKCGLEGPAVCTAKEVPRGVLQNRCRREVDRAWDKRYLWKVNAVYVLHILALLKLCANLNVLMYLSLYGRDGLKQPLSPSLFPFDSVSFSVSLCFLCTPFLLLVHAIQKKNEGDWYSTYFDWHYVYYFIYIVSCKLLSNPQKKWAQRRVLSKVASKWYRWGLDPIYLACLLTEDGDGDLIVSPYSYSLQ